MSSSIFGSVARAYIHMRGPAQPKRALLLALLGHATVASARSATSKQVRSQCTDIDLEYGYVAHSAFGGHHYCCSVGHDPTDTYCPPGKICCPSKDSNGNDSIFNLEYNDYYAANVCPACIASGTCTSSLKMSRIQYQSGDSHDNLHLLLANSTPYYPTWPTCKEGGSADDDDHVHDAECPQGQTVFKGYLYNGAKIHSSLIKNMLQINQCTERSMVVTGCFQNDEEEPVMMQRAAIRIFDIDQQYYPKSGPEAMQFNCYPGTFDVFGENHMYVSWNAGQPEIEPDFTQNGLDKYTYTCPDELVTLWSSVSGTTADNPTDADASMLTASQEEKSVVINFANSECFEITMASLPPEYRQVGWKKKEFGRCCGSHDSYPWKKSSQGGNPLNGSTPLNAANFPGAIFEGDCGLGASGRNWMLGGYLHEDGLCASPPPSLTPPHAPPSPSPPPPSSPSPTLPPPSSPPPLEPPPPIAPPPLPPAPMCFTTEVEIRLEEPCAALSGTLGSDYADILKDRFLDALYPRAGAEPRCSVGDVTMSITASGETSEFTDTSSLAAKVAEVAGVPADQATKPAPHNGPSFPLPAKSHFLALTARLCNFRRCA